MAARWSLDLLHMMTMEQGPSAHKPIAKAVFPEVWIALLAPACAALAGSWQTALRGTQALLGFAEPDEAMTFNGLRALCDI